MMSKRSSLTANKMSLEINLQLRPLLTAFSLASATALELKLKPKYAVTLSNYNKAVAQRNILLKDIAYHSELYDTLDIWEDRIAFFASEIVRQRLGYINKLSMYSQDIYDGLSSGREKLDISYLQQTVIAGDTKQELYENTKNQLYLS